MKLLAIGDLHLGRRPSRLPRALAQAHRARELGPIGAWERLVTAAVAEQVDAVVFSGDVVERENDFFEAYRELHRGVTRLAEAGIQVFGVAGNHDVKVLPRLADQIGAFTLLGRGGAWEKAELDANGEKLTLWGWSFSGDRAGESPLAGAAFDRGPGPNLGILHCDRDQMTSRYAPVASRDLVAAGMDGWLLGHIHKPDTLSAADANGYLGSVSGNDPGEPGDRGPWLLSVSGGRIEELKQWVLAPLRWEVVAVDIEGIGEAEEARETLLKALHVLDGKIATGSWVPEAVGLRVHFTGRTGFGEGVVSLFSEDDRDHLVTGEQGTHYFIERIENRTRPAIPLEELAERNDPAGLLAARLLLLDRASDDPARVRLVSDARKFLEQRARESRWAGLKAASPDVDETVQWLRRSGMVALERLLAQREETV